MTNVHCRYPTSPLFFKLNLFKLENIYKTKIAELMRLQHKMQTNKNNPINITNMSDSGSFKMLSNTHKYKTRQACRFNYFLPRVRTK